MFITTRLRVISVILSAPLILRGQDPTANQAELIRALLARIDKLEKRVSELESKTVPAPAAVIPAVPTAAVPEAPHEHDMPPSSYSTPNLRIGHGGGWDRGDN